MTRHGYHVVQLSPWPLFCSAGVFSLAIGFTMWVHGEGMKLVFLGLFSLVVTLVGWWWDVIVEATYLGRHTSLVYRGLRIGMILFILSEVMFFFGFFWSYLYYSHVMGHMWPPYGISPLYPYGVPLLNTVVLLVSGVSVTWCQRCLSGGNREEALFALSVTTVLGAFFTCLQVQEFYLTSFSIADTVYGSVFFIMTGFHGVHVIVGTIFLLVNLFRIWFHHYSPSHHFGFSAASWYWHFVDVVWIMLYLLVYCLGYYRYSVGMMYY